MTINSDRISAFLFLVFSLAYGVLAGRIDLYAGAEAEVFTARTFPAALAWAGVIVALLMLVVPSSGSRELSPAALRRYDWPRFLILCGLMVAYGLTIQAAGFLVATTGFLVGGFWILGERNWRVLLGASVPIVVCFHLILGALGITIVDPVLAALGLTR